MVDADEALAECVGGHLDLAGPVTVERLVDEGELPSGGVRGVPVTVARARSGLARRQALGSAIELPDGRWCARHLLVRIHAASRSRRRRRVEAVPVASYIRFLTCWQHLAPGTQAEGRAGLLSVIEQLQGIEAPAGEWERHLLPARVAGYDPRWLDELCLAGQVAWGRLTPRPDVAADSDEPAHRGTSTPSPATPLALTCREDLGWTLAAVRAGREVAAPTVGASADLLAVLPSRGASFRSELPGATGRLDSDVDEGLWDLVSRGIVTADAFAAVRSLLAARARRGPGRAGRDGAPRSAGPAPCRGAASVRAGGRSCPTRRSPVRGPARSPRSWPRPWPGSSWPAGVSSPGTCGSASPTGSPGATSCVPCGGSRPGARSWAGGSWPASPASSTRPRTPPTSSPRCTVTPGVPPR